MSKIRKQWISREEYEGGLAAQPAPSLNIDAGNVGGLTAGSIPFADAGGFLTEDNTALFWHAANETLRIASATTLLLDLNPAFTGTGEVINITPSASLDAGSHWDGVKIDVDALDPATGAVCSVHGYHFTALNLASIDHDAQVVGFLTRACAADDFTGFQATITEVTQDVAQNAFLAFGGAVVLSATGKYRGLYVDYDGLTRDGGAPILEGVRIKLPANYTNFGASFAGYFEGDGRSVTICDATYALDVSGIARLTTGSTIGNLTLANGSITDSGGAISFGDENLSTTGTFIAGAANVNETLLGASVNTGGHEGVSLHHDGTEAWLIAADFGVAWHDLTLQVHGVNFDIDGVADAVVINSSGVGIGTATVPHGGIGWAKVAIEGTNASSAGPNIQFTTNADDYPLMQISPYSHDNVCIYFDAYYDGGASAKSSSVNSNFAIYKTATNLDFLYDSGIAQGALTTWNVGISLDTSGDVTVAGCVSDSTCEIMKNEDALAIIDDILKTGNGKKDKYDHERMDMKKIHGKYPFMIHEQITEDEEGKEKIGYFDKLGAKSDLIYVAIGQLNKKIEVLEAQLNN